jgi:hypothetical protein
MIGSRGLIDDTKTSSRHQSVSIGKSYKSDHGDLHVVVGRTIDATSLERGKVQRGRRQNRSPPWFASLPTTSVTLVLRY